MTASEFTIRNKSKNPIFTLRPATLQLLLEANPEASQMTLAKYCRTYKQLTGKAITLDHEQNMQFLRLYGADERGTWTSAYAKLPMPWFLVDRFFRDGYLADSFSGFKEELVTAEAFYSLLASKLPNGA